MTSSNPNFFRGIVRAANQWLKKTPERALNEAYEAALKIKSIEDTHFDGGLITSDVGNYSDSVRSLFQRDLNIYLNTIKVRLTEFNTSNSVVKIVDIARPANPEIQIDASSESNSDNDDSAIQTLDIVDEQRVILNKLKFIDEIRTRYPSVKASEKLDERRSDRPDTPPPRQRKSPPPARPSIMSPSVSPMQAARVDRASFSIETKSTGLTRSLTSTQKGNDAQSFADKTGVVPRSILRTVDRIKRELDPEAEEDVVEEFRQSKARTFSAIYFILLLIVVPLLTQQISKNFVVGPIVDYFRSPNDAIEMIELSDPNSRISEQLFLNGEMDEDALQELQHYHEQLKFQILIGRLPPLSDEEMQEKVKEKAVEIYDGFYYRSSDALKNVFADFFSLLAFALVIISSKQEITILKSFIDEVIYGLSDSAKAFIIILLTDTFVGFHSPHGWEIILEGISRHFGLPANRDFIFLFIATFPVVLDTIFKYWIFRYLNRISPSAVATYKNMNE
ncbi:MAG: proton extrusion protein PcxA [Leptolyngbyaceae cyanobacterium]